MTAQRFASMALAAAVLTASGAPSLSSSEDAGVAGAPPPTLRVLTYNIHHGAGNDEVLDLERIARLIRTLEPDLVALQEVDIRTERTGGVDQAAELGRLTGMSAVFGPFMDFQGGEYGMAVLSALPIVDSRNHRLPEGAEPRSALAVRVRLPGDAGELTFVGIHLYRTEEERLAQTRRLLDELPSEAEGPVILAGDFNSRPGSSVMELIGETFTVADKGGDRFTFPSHRPDREIDFVAWRPDGRFAVVESRAIDEPVASDHRPVLLVLEARPPGAPTPSTSRR
jgi:endonuclease/exonuclease/phosphatase family metal-dependent hydrolase